MRYAYLFTLLVAGLLVPAATAQPRTASQDRALGWEAQQRTEATSLGRRLAPAERDPRTRPDLIQHQVFDGTTWILEGQQIFTYQGVYRKEAWTYVRDGEALFNETRTTYHVGPAEPVAELVEAWDRESGAFVPAHRYVNLTDDENGAVRTGLLYQEWDGAAWADRERTTYAFQALPPTYINVVVGATTEVWDGEAWTPAERYHMVEADSGVVETTETWDGTGWVAAERVYYNGQLIITLYDQLQRLRADLEDYGDLSLALRLFPAHVRQDWDGTAWVNTERLAWETFDMLNGLPTVIRHEVWHEGRWQAEARTEIVFDQNAPVGHPSALHLQVYGNEWTTFFTETYQYDAAANLVKAEQQMDTGAGLEDVAWYTIRWKNLATGVEDEETPGGFALDAAYPNPFNPATTLTYHLAAAGPVAVRVYDALGRKVATLADGVEAAGAHEVTFQAAGLPSGLYLVRLEAPGFAQTRPVTLAK